MALHGFDVSRHQGEVDFNAYRAAGYHFGIIKCTEGTKYAYIDWFRRHFPKLKASGLVPGVYHFLRAGEAAAQARYFVSEVNRLGGFNGVLAVLDVETAANGTKPTISDVRAFATEFKRIVPNHTLIIYTGRWYWVGHMGNPRGSDIGPLWHSEYETTQAEINDGPEVDNYGGWSAATIWQYTSTPIDKNLFYGTTTQLRALAGGGAAQGDGFDMAEIADLENIVQREVQRLGDKLMLGISNPLFPPTRPDVTLPQIKAALNVDALVSAIVAGVAARLPTTLPDGSLTADAVEEAVKQALREGVA